MSELNETEPTAQEPLRTTTEPTIVVNIPPQKTSKAPWVVLFVLLALLLIVTVAGVASCTSALGSMVGGSQSDTMTVPDTVAVIHLDGTISGSGSGSVTPETFRSELQAAEKDGNVKAIVIRIDSGGGSAASSEEIASYIEGSEKPVVVSISDMCASGAYYAASQADYIVSDGGATVGSIGVIITKYDATELLDKLGIKVESIVTGADKGDTNYYSSLTDEQRAALQKEVDSINAHFIDAVSNGRGLDRGTVAGLATGATWSGYQALDLGLIDSIGTYQDALDKAASLAGVGSDYHVSTFDVSTGSGSLLSLLLGAL